MATTSEGTHSARRILQGCQQIDTSTLAPNEVRWSTDMTSETTRRHPRTLQDAFKGSDYASPLTRPQKARVGLLDGLLWFLACLLLLAIVYAPAVHNYFFGAQS